MAIRRQLSGRRASGKACPDNEKVGLAVVFENAAWWRGRRRRFPKAVATTITKHFGFAPSSRRSTLCVFSAAKRDRWYSEDFRRPRSLLIGAIREPHSKQHRSRSRAHPWQTLKIVETDNWASPHAP